MAESLIPPHGDERRREDVLLSCSRVIGPVLGVHELVDRTAKHMAGAIDAHLAMLLLHEADRGRFWTRTTDGPGDWPKRLYFDDDQGLCGHVFRTQESVLSGDVSRSACFSDTARKLAEWTGSEPRSMVAVPVCVDSADCHAVLVVADNRVDRFTDDDLSLVQAIAEQIGVGLVNARRYEAQHRQFDTFVQTISRAIDARDAITMDHSANIANYAMAIGQVLGVEAGHIESLRVAALLHDLGKIGTPDRSLTKAGRLKPYEFEQVKKHALYTRQILSQVEFAQPLKDTAALAASHHEKPDGSGYPDGLAGTEVPLKARILAVADIFHTLTQPRHYREGMELNQAISILDDMVPDQLDARCVAALKGFLGIGPMPDCAA